MLFRSSTSSEERATAAWKRTLAEYEAPAIDSGVDAALIDFVARRKAETPDRWH